MTRWSRRYVQIRSDWMVQHVYFSLDLSRPYRIYGWWKDGVGYRYYVEREVNGSWWPVGSSALARLAKLVAIEDSETP